MTNSDWLEIDYFNIPDREQLKAYLSKPFEGNDQKKRGWGVGLT